MELSDHFSFLVPGYKYMPAYRNKAWDGKIRLFDMRAGELNAGLFQYLKAYVDQRGYQFDVQTNTWGSPLDVDTIDPDEISQMLIDVKSPYTLRNYQMDAVKHALERYRAILLCPTGSGKSFIAYTLVQRILGSVRGNVLIVVPTTGLVEQLTNDFKEYGFDIEANVHKIYSGKEKITKKRVIISTWQSIYKFPRQWFEQFDAIIGDECHGFKSKSLSSIMNKATKALYRFGMTGTLDGTQTHKLVLEGLFGPVYKVTTTKKLQDQNVLADLEITMLLLNYNQTTRKQWGVKTYPQEIDFLIKHEKRNKFIRNLALAQTGNTLVLFQRVDKHGKVIFDLIRSKAAEDRKIFFVSGGTDVADREAIRHIVEKQSNAIIVASLGTFSTGINIRNLHNIIFASPSKSQIKVLQSIGRGLRKSDDGSTTKLFDLADNIEWDGQKNYTLVHSIQRAKIYKAEQFKMKSVMVDIE